MTCNNVCDRYATREKFRRGDSRYTDNTCWCKACNMWLDKTIGLENFRCKCCHGKVRILARTHWRNKKREL